MWSLKVCLVKANGEKAMVTEKQPIGRRIRPEQGLTGFYRSDTLNNATPDYAIVAVPLTDLTERVDLRNLVGGRFISVYCLAITTPDK